MTTKLEEDKLHLPTGETVTPDELRYNPLVHIGKRSAAGLYCYDCKVSLCVDGEKRVHYTRSPKMSFATGSLLPTDCETGWHKACPKCKKEPIKEGLDAGPVAVELGFAKPRTQIPSGVRGTSSFNWAQDPLKVTEFCGGPGATAKVIKDEYDREYTGKEFLEMLKNNCRIMLYSSIGQEFS
jgi:hypothetical protein